MAKAHLDLVIPAIENGPVTRGRPPKRRRNSEARVREYLTGSEVDRLIAAAGKNRHGHRNSTLILIAFRHGLRPIEAVGLRWDAIDFDRGEIYISRVKRDPPPPTLWPAGSSGLYAKFQREQAPKSSFVFTSERGAPFATGGFRTLVARLGKAAGFDFRVHPHMLRHACGYALANQEHSTRAVQAYLGHRNIQHTVRYTELSPTRFKNFWRD